MVTTVLLSHIQMILLQSYWEINCFALVVDVIILLSCDRGYKCAGTNKLLRHTPAVHCNNCSRRLRFLVRTAHTPWAAALKCRCQQSFSARTSVSQKRPALARQNCCCQRVWVWGSTRGAHSTRLGARRQQFTSTISRWRTTEWRGRCGIWRVYPLPVCACILH